MRLVHGGPLELLHPTPVSIHRMEVRPVFPQPRRFGWYLVLVVLVLFAIKNPDGAAHMVRLGGGLLSAAAGALSKIADAI